ncbi:7-cyano-7-deazaguanine synthase [Candidatus Roizmanbacteria bacterium]|nr:MAG: 7-cyano-7-deazaguanine synthase [Candidatus Roizmanbacteria bacterium]
MKLPKLTSKQLQRMLIERKLEDLSALKCIESFLKEKRGYVFRMPQKGESVILTVSGGLDSTILWGMLLEEYQMQVYPVFFRRGHKRIQREENAVRFFSQFFQKKYAKLFQTVQYLDVPMPPKEIRWKITEHSQEVVSSDTNQRKGLPLYSGLLALNAAEYALFLQEEKNVSIRTIFSAFVTSDGESLKYETLTAMRSVMQNLCILTGDMNWQYTSLALEKELGFFWDKDILIRWATEKGYPLEKMFSCISPINYKIHCGRCYFCQYRKQSFLRAGISDPTEYKFHSRGPLAYS